MVNIRILPGGFVLPSINEMFSNKKVLISKGLK